jgi:hypothetical protein
LSFVLVVLFPLFVRIRQPTILGDDVVRIADLIRFPFRELVFLPFSEHVAPCFQLVSWLVWQLIGHDVRLAPVGFTAASVVAWALVLFLLGVFLVRETGSRTASLVALALVAQSPLVLETAWWYSSSSFSWAVAGILIVVLGAGSLARRPCAALCWIAIGSALAPAGTTLGIMAAPLAIARTVLLRGVSRLTKLAAVAVALIGLLAYEEVCNLAGDVPLGSARMKKVDMHDPLAGLGYAVSVPGRVLLPSTIGIPASLLVEPQSPALVSGAAICALAAIASLAAYRRAGWNRRLILFGCICIYINYILIYCSRAGFVKSGLWTEAQLLYEWGGRYHILPLVGLAAVIAAVLARWPLLERCDRQRGLPAAIGAAVGLLFLIVQTGERKQKDWMLNQPDQRGTLAVLYRVGEVARAEGITRAQLQRIVEPAWRAWNASLLHDRPWAFPLVMMIANVPEESAQVLTDADARSRLQARLTQRERNVLGSEACVSLNPARITPGTHIVSIGRRVQLCATQEIRPGRFRGDYATASYLEYEFDSGMQARYLALPGLEADQDVLVSWCESAGRWRPGQSVRWLRPHQTDEPAVIDFQRLIQWSGKPVARVRISFTRTGELALGGAPRLLR